MLKRSWLFFIVVACCSVTPVMACPHLSGIFDCTTNGHTERMIIRQQEVDYVTHYLVTGTEIVADGLSHALPHREPEEKALYRATCYGEALRVVVEQVLITGEPNKARIGTLNFELWMNRDPAGKLHRKVQGIVSLDGDGNYPLSEGTVCVPR
ncbi:MAG: hypothetical protein H6624_20070 [Bdellovibrionaceae bacterium]|nr:hypothetical protein [Bdellovibrionales bacterium]MCB9086649.1 hypothetical protein [Pseudobdellovibrionaceae bacterium]